MKRTFDFCCAILALLLLLPIMVLVSLLIRIKLGSPVFFVQERPGLNGKVFRMFKFRTMRNDKNSKNELLSDSERMTSLGTFIRSTSLDELPGLINIIKGDMSIVGPRPLLIEYMPLYSERQRRRHSVRPGLTGWAQVNGRNAISWKEKFDYDVWYVDNQSLFLDLKIIMLTIKKVCTKEGISAEGHVTTERFRGNQSD